MKKVLIITYYWPPSGGGGVQRWLKFVKYLPQYGIKPIVVAPENAEYPNYDNSLINDISSETEVIKIPIWEPYQLFKIFTGKKANEKVNSGLLSKSKKKSITERISIWIRGNILIPDPRVFWVRPATKYLIKYLKNANIDTVITTGPPHSVHLIGLKLKKKLNIKWLADFRDPWSEIDYLEEFNLGKLAIKRHRSLEKKILTNADQIITVSSNWAKDLERLGAKNVEVITNGFDEDDFSIAQMPEENSNEFVLLYSGILQDYRNPEFLWDALEDICQENEDFANSFQLKLYGTVDESVLNYIKNLPYLSNCLHNGGYISHSNLVSEYKNANVLLLLQNDTKNALGHIPGKLFEYLAANKKIITIGKEESDVAEILNLTKAGKLYAEKNVLDLKKDLFIKITEKDHKLIEPYTRKTLTKKLAAILEKQSTK
ncbi:MAG: glycosyltransferase [Salinivirgaceae bacterium]|nr:glycosyltransferase [Salinivirgaceae bacterium]